MTTYQKKSRDKSYDESKNVYDAAVERIEYIYKIFDNVEVAFSGGKDSTALLHTTIDVARKLGRLPVVTHFLDEEAIHDETPAYVERVRRNNNDVDLRWYCVPVRYRNACSNKQPHWHPWHPDEKHKWVRDLPEDAITMTDNFEWGMELPDWMASLYKNHKERGTTCFLMGIRTQESMNRFRGIVMKKNDHFITKRTPDSYVGSPIYDWSSVDVWKLVSNRKLDYNKVYDMLNKTKQYNRLLAQRVCQPFGEEPLRRLWEYAEISPDLFHKMLYRVPGVATAWRYHNTELYGIGNAPKPEHVTWQQYVKVILESYEKKTRKEVAEGLDSMVKHHFKRTNDPIPDESGHPWTGVSWKFLTKIAIKGDLKSRTRGKLIAEAERTHKVMGINWKEAEEKYAKQNATAIKKKL